MLTQNNRLIGIIVTIIVLLSIPLIAMQFTNEVDWDGRDFLIMGVLMLTVGLSCEMILRKVKSFERRLLYVGIALVIFFLIWAELAVGIFGSPFAGS